MDLQPYKTWVSQMGLIRAKSNYEIDMGSNIVVGHNDITGEFISLLLNYLLNGGTVTPVQSLYAYVYYQGQQVDMIPMNVIYVNENGNSLELVATGTSTSNTGYSFDTIEIGTGNYMISIISTSGKNTGELTIEWSFSDVVTSDSPNQIQNNVKLMCAKWCNDNKEVCLHTSLGLNSCINGLFTGYSGNENIIQYVINLLVIPVSSYPNNSPFYSLFQSTGTPYNLQGLQYVIVTNDYQPIAYKKLQFVSNSTLPVSGYNYAIAYYGIGGVPYALVDGSIPSNEVVLTVNFNMSGDIQSSSSSYP